MPSEHKSGGSDQAELAAYQVWESVERRLWSRARLILLFVVIGIALVVLLGVPLIKSSVEQRVMEQSRAMFAERLVAEQAQINTLREEYRSDTRLLREQLGDARVQAETELSALQRQAEELQTKYGDFAVEGAKLEATQDRITQVQLALKNEEKRLRKLRIEFEKNLRNYTANSEAMLSNAPKVIFSELGRVENMIERELDELRLVLADQMSGKPAMYSTYFNPDDRRGEVVGANFGTKAGRVFLRVHVFAGESEEPEAHSDSFILPSASWDDSRIALRLSARALEQIAEVEDGLSRSVGESAKVRYGFLIQTADGKLSQWSARRASSIVPTTRRSAAEAEDKP